MPRITRPADHQVHWAPVQANDLTRSGLLEAAYGKAGSILKTIEDDLREAPWYTPDWLKLVLDHTMQEFEAACDRWRSLFRSAKAQFEYQNSIIADVARRPMREDVLFAEILAREKAEIGARIGPAVRPPGEAGRPRRCPATGCQEPLPLGSGFGALAARRT